MTLELHDFLRHSMRFLHGEETKMTSATVKMVPGYSSLESSQ